MPTACAIRKNRTGNDDRLEIRLPATLLAEIRAHVDGRDGCTLADWVRTALIEKLAADRRQDRWRKERVGLNALEQAIKRMQTDAAVQTEHAAQKLALAESARSDCTDNDQEDRG